jgi:hypothetical protein
MKGNHKTTKMSQLNMGDVFHLGMKANPLKNREKNEIYDSI